MLLIASSLVLQSFYVIPIVLKTILQRWEYDAISSDYLGISYFVCGIFGSTIVCLIKDKFSFRLLNISTTTLSLVCLYFFRQAVTNYKFEDSYMLFKGDKCFITISLFGFFNISFYGIFWSHAVSLTPRIGEAISTSLINMMANVLGLVQTYIWATFEKRE